MIINKWKFSLWLTITVAFMIGIYWVSDMPYRQQDIKQLLQQKVNLTDKSIPDYIDFTYDTQHITYKKPYQALEFFIRKFAHIFEYCVLTLLWWKTIAFTRLSLLPRISICIMLPFLYACFDEWHQTFVSGRTGHFIDVALPDALGILLALLCVLIYRRIPHVKRRSSVL